MKKIKKTGGARIGTANATWPFASLTVTKDYLKLNATIIGNFIFKTGDIVSIEPYRGNGLKINHKVTKYNDKIIFWTFSRPRDLIKEIEQTGFFDNTDSIPADLDNNIKASQAKGGFPVKIEAAIAIIVIWNVFFLFDFLNFNTNNAEGSPLGIGAKLGLGFVLLICILLLTYEPVRKIVLKEGRDIGDIKVFIYFLMFLCGFMLITVSFT